MHRNPPTRLGLGSLHRNDFTERCVLASCRSPQDGVCGTRWWERSVEVGQKDQSLGPDALIVEPFEARTEFRSSSADRIEIDAFSGVVCFNVVHLCVEVENVNVFRTLAFKNRTHFSFKKPQLARAHRAGAVDSDRDLTYALAHHSRQIEPCPEVATVRAHPAI